MHSHGGQQSCPPYVDWAIAERISLIKRIIFLKRFDLVTASLHGLKDEQTATHVFVDKIQG